MCSTQGNNENRSSIIRKKKVKWMSTAKQWETLQRPCVSVTQEEWDSFTEIMNDKWTKKKM